MLGGGKTLNRERRVKGVPRSRVSSCASGWFLVRAGDAAVRPVNGGWPGLSPKAEGQGPEGPIKTGREFELLGAVWFSPARVCAEWVFSGRPLGNELTQCSPTHRPVGWHPAWTLPSARLGTEWGPGNVVGWKAIAGRNA